MLLLNSISISTLSNLSISKISKYKFPISYLVFGELFILF